MKHSLVFLRDCLFIGYPVHIGGEEALETDRVQAAAAERLIAVGGTSGEWTIGPNEWTGEWTNGPNEWTGAPRLAAAHLGAGSFYTIHTRAPFTHLSRTFE